ncbi:hypothetical protein CYY_004069 [Polysphondylium violaceum]|uniref:Ankyrin repeat-containing protein n=1 Tax=Polysphondylium violaceum TaxID=133409 RepID=A0A8J4PWS3_9MYCE|nr:hypothetical protein CYY_004069 [Polysphondylium violaceum]
MNKSDLFFKIVRDKPLFRYLTSFLTISVNGFSFMNCPFSKAIIWRIFDEKVDLFFNVFQQDPTKHYYMDPTNNDLITLCASSAIPFDKFVRLFQQFETLYRDNAIHPIIASIATQQIEKVQYLLSKYRHLECSHGRLVEGIRFALATGPINAKVLQLIFDYVNAQSSLNLFDRGKKVFFDSLVESMLQSPHISQDVALVLYNSGLSDIFHSHFGIREVCNHGYLEVARLMARDRRSAMCHSITRITTYSLEVIKLFLNIRYLDKNFVHRMSFDSLDLLREYLAYFGWNSTEWLNFNIVDLLDESSLDILDFHCVSGQSIDPAALGGNLFLVKYLHHSKNGVASVGATNSCFEIVQFLIENRSEGFTDVHLTNCYFGDIKTVRYLHEKSLDPSNSVPILFSFRSIDRCASHGYYDIIKFLLENRKEGFSRDAINNAVSGGYLNIVKLLLSYNSTFTLFENSIQTAVNKGAYDVLEYLQTTVYANQVTPLMLAQKPKKEIRKAPAPLPLLDDDQLYLAHSSHLAHLVARGCYEQDDFDPLKFVKKFITNKKPPGHQILFLIHTIIHHTNFSINYRLDFLFRVLTVSITMGRLYVVDYFSSLKCKLNIINNDTDQSSSSVTLSTFFDESPKLKKSIYSTDFSNLSSISKDYLNHYGFNI